MSSEFTKVTRTKLWFWRILDWILLFLPLAIYVCVALANEGVTVGGKVGIVGTVAVAGILNVFNVIAQKRLRCPLWIILLGLYIAMKDVLMPLIIILAVTSIIDDLILTPIISYYRTKLTAHKAIDEREVEKVPV